MTSINNRPTTSPIKSPKEIPLSLFVFLIFSILYLVFIIYLPVTKNYFYSDDYSHLVFLKENGFSYSGFLKPVNEHFQPLFRAIQSIEYHFFELDAPQYYLVNIGLHLANVLLIIILFSSLFSERITGLLSGLIFGIFSCSSQVLTWVVTQGQQIATFWFLLSAVLFVHFLKNPTRCLSRKGSYFCHSLMLISFSCGLETPFIFFLLYLAFEYHKNNSLITKKDFISGFKIIFPYFFNILILLIARSVLLPTNLDFIQRSGGWEGIIRNIPLALKFTFGGFYYGYLSSFLGTCSLPTDSIFFSFYTGGLIILLFVLLDYSKNGIAKYRGYLAPLAVGILLIYSFPTLPRIPWGFTWFVTTSRYYYLPGPLAAALAAVFLKSLRPFTQHGGIINRVAQFSLICFFLHAGLVNIAIIKKQISIHNVLTNNFKIVQLRLMNNIRDHLTSHKTIQMIDEPLSDSSIMWNVNPNLLAKLYLSSTDQEKIHFIDLNQKIDKSEPVYIATAIGELQLYNPDFNKKMKTTTTY